MVYEKKESDDRGRIWQSIVNWVIGNFGVRFSIFFRLGNGSDVNQQNTLAEYGGGECKKRGPYFEAAGKPRQASQLDTGGEQSGKQRRVRFDDCAGDTDVPWKLGQRRGDCYDYYYCDYIDFRRDNA